VGNDPLGKEAIRLAKELGIRTDAIATDAELPTGQCIVSLDERGVPSYHIPEQMSYDRIPIPPVSKHFDVFAFGTFALRSKQNRETLRAVMTQHRFSQIYADLNIRPPFYSKESIALCLENATIVKISDEELPLVTRTIFEAALNLEQAVTRIAKEYPQIRLLLITKGADGAVCYDLASTAQYDCPAEPAEVVSTVGAGDSFGATFLTRYAQTGDIDSAMRLAAKVSAFVVSNKEAIPTAITSYLQAISIL
jgi:fructokinase